MYQLLQRTYPGQLPTVRRNLHHFVMPVDFTKSEDVEIVLENLQLFVKRSVPIRFGLVPRSDSPEASKQAKIAYHLVESYGLAALLVYFQEVSIFITLLTLKLISRRISNPKL